MSSICQIQSFHTYSVHSFNLSDQISKGIFLFIGDLPTFPYICVQVLMNFDLFDFSRFSQLKEWYGEIDEGIPHLIDVASLDVLDKFDGLKGSDAAGGSG